MCIALQIPLHITQCDSNYVISSWVDFLVDVELHVRQSPSQSAPTILAYQVGLILFQDWDLFFKVTNRRVFSKEEQWVQIDDNN